MEDSVFFTIFALLLFLSPLILVFIGIKITPNTNDEVTPEVDYTKKPFEASLVMLTAIIHKANGKVKDSEKEFVKDFINKRFSEKTVKKMLVELAKALHQDLNHWYVCAEVRCSIDYSSKLQIMQYLFGIAKADGEISSDEFRMLDLIANEIGIHIIDYESIKAMFGFKSYRREYKSSSTYSYVNGQAYTILGVTSSASNDEIKKAYRQMVMKFHPDKVSHLGEKVKADAEEKLRRLNAAYEEIKKAKGIK